MALAVKYSVVREYPSHKPGEVAVVLQSAQGATVEVGPEQDFPPLNAAEVKNCVFLWDPSQVPIEVEVVLQFAHGLFFTEFPQLSALIAWIWK